MKKKQNKAASGWLYHKLLLILLNFDRYASCVGNDTRHCDKQTSTTTTKKEVTGSTKLMEKETVFLGIILDSNEIELALYIQFGLVILLLSFSSLMICVSISFSKKIKRLSKMIPMQESFEKL